jgi:PAS domain S-box-containing protein
VMSSLEKEIAQHQETEQALRQSEERLRLAVHGAGMGTWDLNWRTGQAVWSETHFKMLGYEPAPGGQATREMWLARVHPDDLERVLEGQEQARRERGLHCPEYRIRRPNGDVAWLGVCGRFFYDETGEAVRFLGVSFDITRRKELECEVLEIAAREQRRIGQELHDGVGQELTGLGLMANALAQRLQKTVTEKCIADRLVTVLDQVHQQVRTLSRGLVPVQVEAKGMCAALDDLAASTSERSGVLVTFDCQEWVEVSDHATATQLFRIAQEAVSNALRHAQPRRVNLSLRSSPDSLYLSIRDDGAGMQQPPQQTKGMGLRIMRYRAEEIGAALHIVPGEGGGTIVTCMLPRRKANEEPRNGAVQGENPDRG